MKAKIQNTKFTLKYRRLELWMRENDLSHSELASALHIPTNVLYKKLWKREYFSPEQIKNLVDLLTAREAIEVLFFPTMKEKVLIYKQVFEA